MRLSLLIFAAGSAGLALGGAADSSCLKNDRDKCSSSIEEGSGEACVWCECKAIPSECVSLSMSKRLPSAVFKCGVPKTPLLDVESDTLTSTLAKAPQLFQGWKAIHNKEYESVEEEASRLEAFTATLSEVTMHNMAGVFSYTLEVNQFADMTWDDFKATRLGVSSSQNCSATHMAGTSKDAPHRGARLPKQIDWRAVGAVSPVKDQGACGSCWTFSSTGCLESHHFLRTGEMVLLSEQQLVDCAQNFDNHGCNGGLPSHSWEYIAAVGGLETEEAYPYHAVQDSCKFSPDPSNIGAKAYGSVNITFQDEYELMQAVASFPVSIAFEVYKDFKSYAGGVYDNPACDTSPDMVNHAVLAVGYGTNEQEGDFWILKNSWKASWGEDGFFRMRRGLNMCGISDCASYPITKKENKSDKMTNDVLAAHTLKMQ